MEYTYLDSGTSIRHLFLTMSLRKHAIKVIYDTNAELVDIRYPHARHTCIPLYSSLSLNCA